MMKNNIWYKRYLLIKQKIIMKKNYYFYFKKKNKIKVIGTDKTLDFILNRKVSVVRFGDGEFDLIFKENLKFQKYNKEMAKLLKEILLSKEKDLLVCIPDIFNDLNIYTEKGSKFWKEYLLKKINKLFKILDTNKIYYSSQISRFYLETSDKTKVESRVKKILKIWEGKEVVIIEGEKSRLGIGNDLLSKASKVERILCPSHEAYEIYEKIYNEALKINKNKLILLALGPTATILGYHLHKKGYQVLDIGHIDIEYEWYLKKVDTKVPIANKYIGEVSELNSVQDIKNLDYEEQIIKKILRLEI